MQDISSSPELFDTTTNMLERLPLSSLTVLLSWFSHSNFKMIYWFRHKILTFTVLHWQSITMLYTKPKVPFWPFSFENRWRVPLKSRQAYIILALVGLVAADNLPPRVGYAPGPVYQVPLHHPRLTRCCRPSPPPPPLAAVKEGSNHYVQAKAILPTPLGCSREMQ